MYDCVQHNMVARFNQIYKVILLFLIGREQKTQCFQLKEEFSTYSTYGLQNSFITSINFDDRDFIHLFLH